MPSRASIWRRPLSWSGLVAWCRRRPLLPLGAGVLVLLIAGRGPLLRAADYHAQRWYGRPLNQVRLQPFIDRAWYRMAHRYIHADVAFPPHKAWLIVLKDENLIEVWASNWWFEPIFIGYYSFRYKGWLGPKLHEDDVQLPEGQYRVSSLEAVDSHYLAAQLDFPNQYDRRQARREQRPVAGRKVFIHGGDPVPGGIAISERAMEELYLLCSGARRRTIQVLIVPVDFRHAARAQSRRIPSPPWQEELYADLAARLAAFPAPPKPLPQEELETLPAPVPGIPEAPRGYAPPNTGR